LPYDEIVNRLFTVSHDLEQQLILVKL